MALPVIAVVTEFDPAALDGRPAMPASWEWTKEDFGWTIYPEGRNTPRSRIYCIYIGDDGSTYGLYIAAASKFVLRELSSRVDKYWTLPDLRDDTGAWATAAKRVWTSSEKDEEEVGRFRLIRTVSGLSLEADAETTTEADL